MLKTVGLGSVLVLASGLALAQQQTPPDPPPAAPSATPVPAAPAPAAAPVAAVGSVKVICDGKVKTNGEVHLTFTPTGGAAKDVSVTLQKGMSKSEVCRDVAKELSVMLGASYKVDQYDDDKVKIEGKDNATFSLTLGAVTATGITLELK